jgi:hypothetical protein
MYKRHLLASAISLTVLASPVNATVSDQEFAQLRAEFAALAKRLNSLEAENSELRQLNQETIRDVSLGKEQVAKLQASRGSESWTETIKLKGDFRYRYENIDEQGRDERDRNRIRARAHLEARLPNDVKVGLGVASGGDDPVSTNQTLGGGGSTKDIRLNLAYANWQALEGLNIIGGKYKNIWYRPARNGLIFDGDYNPEGVAVAYKKDWFFANLGGTWLESDTRKSNNSYSWGGQLGYKGTVGGANVIAGGSYYNFDTAGGQSFFGDDGDFYGNSFECADDNDLDSCVYSIDYNMIQAFAEVSMDIADMPVSIFADYVVNDDADDNDTGYAVGVKIGRAKAARSWQMAYTYQDLEADAVLGLLTDSDFGGGGTDAKGHVFKGAYAVNKQWVVGFTYFLNEVDENIDNQHDYDRLMIDTQFKY